VPRDEQRTRSDSEPWQHAYERHAHGAGVAHEILDDLRQPEQQGIEADRAAEIAGGEGPGPAVADRGPEMTAAPAVRGAEVLGATVAPQGIGEPRLLRLGEPWRGARAFRQPQ